MSNFPPFSDSPRVSAFYVAHPTDSPLQLPQALSRSEPASLNRSSPLPGNAMPRYSPGGQRSVVPASSSAPSSQGLLVPRSIPASPEGPDSRPLSAEGSSRSNSQQRVSFEGSRASPPIPNQSPRVHVHVHPLREAISQTTRAIDSAVSRVRRSSDPARPPSVMVGAPPTSSSSPKKPGHESSTAARDRATSPSRRFGWSSFYHAREDPFVPVDPFQLRTRFRRLSLHSSDIESHLPSSSTCEGNPFCCITPVHCGPKDRLPSFLQDARYFILDTFPRQIYLHMLLRLPSLYFSRIARVYEDAQLSKPDLERMIDTYSSSGQQQQRQQLVRSSPIPPGAHLHPSLALPFPDEWTTTNVSPALVRFKHSWEAFIDSLLREWKTLNLVSALLASAIIAMFQNVQMANDPIIRTATLLSLTSALMSLSFGCIYIVRFGTMRSMYKATRWAEEAARTTTFILWNVWVLLAMPAIWLAWSMVFFIVAILAYVWRYGSSEDPANPPLLSPTAAIGPRIVVSALFFLGLLYLAAIVKTLHNYGRQTDNRLLRRMTTGNEMPDILEDHARRPDPNAQRGRDGDYGGGSAQANRGRERTRNGQDQDPAEPGGLSAVLGLGLTGLDDFIGPRELDEMPMEKQQHAAGTSV